MHGQTNTRLLSTLLANASLSALIIDSGHEEEANDQYMNALSDFVSNRSFLRDVERTGASAAIYRSDFSTNDSCHSYWTNSPLESTNLSNLGPGLSSQTEDVVTIPLIYICSWKTIH